MGLIFVLHRPADQPGFVPDLINLGEPINMLPPAVIASRHSLRAEVFTSGVEDVQDKDKAAIRRLRNYVAYPTTSA